MAVCSGVVSSGGSAISTSFEAFLERFSRLGCFLRLLRFLHLGLKGLEAQPDLPLLGVHAENLGLDFIAFLDHIAGRLHVATRQFADVDHARALGADVHEGPIGLQAHDLASGHHSGLEVLPLVLEGLDHGEFDAILADLSNPDLHGLPLVQDVLNLLDRNFLQL